MANKNPNTNGLKKSTEEKTQKTIEKVEITLKEMIKKRSKINFNSVCQQSGVSKSFLYKNEQIKDRISTLRKQQEGLNNHKNVKRNMSNDSKDVIIETLKKKNKDLMLENEKLKKQLQNNLGEIYKEI